MEYPQYAAAWNSLLGEETTLKVKLAERQRQHSILPLNLEELKEEKAVQFAAEMTNMFMALEAAHYDITPEDISKGAKTVLLQVAREKIGCVMCDHHLHNISLNQTSCRTAAVTLLVKHILMYFH